MAMLYCAFSKLLKSPPKNVAGLDKIDDTQTLIIEVRTIRGLATWELRRWRTKGLF